MLSSNAWFGRLDVRAPDKPCLAKAGSVRLDRRGMRFLGCESGLSKGLDGLGVYENDIPGMPRPPCDMECIVSGLEGIWADWRDQSWSGRNGLLMLFLPGDRGASPNGMPSELVKSWSYPREVADRLLFCPSRNGLGSVECPIDAEEPHAMNGELLCRAGAVRC